MKSWNVVCTLLSVLYHCNFCLAQFKNSDSICVNFNNATFQEVSGIISPYGHGISFVDDRFGNHSAALYIHGHSRSYFTLGTSPILKNPNISISLWIKPERKVFIGDGYGSNPVLSLKNGPGSDFINAFSVGYDWSSHRIGCNSTKDSTEDITILSKDTLTFNKWYHVVFICNNNFLALYVNGELQGKVKKEFETTFLASDSLVFGHTADTKNKRYMQGSFDDIKIFFHPLSDSEVQRLYNEPNPNRLRRFFDEALKYSLVIGGLIVIIIGLLIRNRRALRKQAQELELVNRMSDLELKAIKAQMNPHFISNCLAAIQELNYHHEREKAGQYIAKFSYYLRQVLNFSDENYIPVAKEIELIRLFIELEELRFSNGFDFRLEIDDSIDVNSTLVPSLITQPFIENAIWHGLLPLEGKRHPILHVRFLKRNGYPLIEIEDNGVGRDPNATLKSRSKGTRLIQDKIDTLNRLSHSSRFKLSILDLKDNQGGATGTKVIIFLDNIIE